jgi:hypothetical protein
MRHGILTILTPILPDRDLETFRQELRALDSRTFPCQELIGLHFASLSVIGKYDNQYAEAPEDFNPHLVFEVSFDGSREDFIDDLVAVMGRRLDCVYKHCSGYPGTGRRLPQLVKNYLLRHDVGADAVFIAYPRRTVGQIHQENQLRDALVEQDQRIRTSDDIRQLEPPMQRSLVRLLRERISQMPHLQGVLTLPERPFLVTYGGLIGDIVLKTLAALLVLGAVVTLNRRWETPTEFVLAPIMLVLAFVTWLIGVWRPQWRNTSLVLLIGAAVVWLLRKQWIGFALDWVTRGLVMVAIVTLSTLGIVILAAVLWILVVQILEWTDPEPPLPYWDPVREHTLRRLENRTAQNHLVGLNRIKPGLFRFRLWTVRLVLWILHATKHFEKAGMLSGLSTIHFARWTVIDKGRQLLFLSHYDGDWDAYLGDFVEQASAGLTAVWSNCVGFPRAWFLVGGGAKDQRAFKAYARQHQHETLYLYSAYPQLTVSDIETHTAIREALGRSLDAAGLAAMLRRL